MNDTQSIQPVAGNTNPDFSEVLVMIRTTRDNVLRVANTTLIDLYWKLGEYISHKLANAEWGDSVVEQLAEHIEQNAPDIKGFSKKNLWRMKQFYETYAQNMQFVSPLVRQISWTNNLLIISRCHSEEEREFYIKRTIEERYSKRELDRQISSALFERTMIDKPKVSTMLRQIAPSAEQVFRDQYVLEFIGADADRLENSMRRSLIQQMKRVILELGKDFIFIDQEYRLQVGNSDFRIDLLFYHRELQCLVTVHRAKRITVVYDVEIIVNTHILFRDIQQLVAVERKVDIGCPIKITCLDHVPRYDKLQTFVRDIAHIGVTRAETACPR